MSLMLINSIQSSAAVFNGTHRARLNHFFTLIRGQTLSETVSMGCRGLTFDVGSKTQRIGEQNLS